MQAWYDPVANLKVFSQSLRLVDLTGDNDVRLLAADLDKKLRVYKGARARAGSTAAGATTPRMRGVRKADSASASELPRVPSSL